MGLFESALVSACIATGSTGNQQMACQKATEAGSKQSGIEKEMSDAEKHTLKKVEFEATDIIGKDGVNVVAGSVFLAKTLQSKSLSVGMPTFGLCSSIKTEIKQDSSIIKFEWKF